MAMRARQQETVSQRWQRALDRALADGLDVLVCAATGEAFVESATYPGTLYAVSTRFCTCKGGMYGAPCKHRAAYLAQIGMLPVDAPPAVEIAPAVVDDLAAAA